MKTSTDVQRILIESQNYHQFLNAVFRSLKQENPKFSYASFARKAGLSSRSFPRDVALGKKRLSLASAKGFSSALGLRGAQNTYFLLLVERDEPSLRGPRGDLQLIESRLAVLRNRLRGQNAKKTSHSTQDVFNSIQWLKIYTASGAVGIGASLEQISERTKIPQGNLRDYLEQMLERNILSMNPKTGQYAPLHSYQIFEDLKSDVFFKNWYLQSLVEIKSKAEKDFSAGAALFFTSMFSVKSAKMQTFRQELRELLQRFSEDSEDPDGDSLAKLLVGFF